MSKLSNIAKNATNTISQAALDAAIEFEAKAMIEKEDAEAAKNWTAKSRTDLAIVMLWYQSQWFQIHCETPSFNHKQEMNERIACDDHIPYEVNYGGEEYSFDLKGVAQDQRWIFENLMYRQSKGTLKHMPHLYVYKFNKRGERIRDYQWRQCVFEEIKQDKNEPFDVSGKSYEPIVNPASAQEKDRLAQAIKKVKANSKLIKQLKAALA